LKTDVQLLEKAKVNILDTQHLLYCFNRKLLKGVNTVSQHRLTPKEIRFLQEPSGAGHKTVDIRLREGEYQYNLGRAIAAFQLELCLPDVKDIIERLYGEEKTNEIKFVRKIQTILKKMERSGVVTILPKGKSWGLQRYVLSSFKFQDVEKNLVSFATAKQIKQMQNLLHSISSQQEQHSTKVSSTKLMTYVLAFIVVISYAAILWNFVQPMVNSIIFILAFSIAAACSLMLGKILSQR